MERTIMLTNETGLHARPAGIFVKAANQFKSKIEVKIPNKIVNAKSIMNLLSLGLENGSYITIVAEGPDEEAAISRLSNLVESKFEIHV